MKSNRLISCLFFWVLVFVANSALAQCDADAGNNVTICVDQDVELGGNPTANGANNPGNVNYSWSIGNNPPFSSDDNPIVSPSTTTTYTVNLSGGGCNGQSSQITVTVIPSSFTVTAQANSNSGPITICAGTSLDLNSSVTGVPNGQNVSYDWSGPNSYDNGNANPGSFNASANAGGTYTVTASIGDCDVSDNISVNVLSASINNMLNGVNTLTYCLGSGQTQGEVGFMINLPSSTSAISYYEVNWGDGSAVQQVNATSTPNWSESITHTYGVGSYTVQLIVHLTNGCTHTTTATAFVGSSPSPATLQLFASQATGCAPWTTQFTFNVASTNVEGTTYTVNWGDGTPVEVYTHPNTPATLTHVYQNSSCGATNIFSIPNAYSATVTTQNPCSSAQPSASSTISVGEPPTSDFDLSAQTVCVGDLVNTINNSDAGVTFTTTSTNCQTTAPGCWTISPSSAGSPAITSGSLGNCSSSNFALWTAGSTNIGATFSQAGTYTYSYRIKNSCGENIHNETLCVINPPVCAFTLTPPSGCSVLNVTSNNTTVPPTCNNVPLALQYNWTISPPSGGTGSGTVSNATAQSPSFTFSNTGTTTITFTVTLSVTPINPQTLLPMTTCSTTCTQTVTVYPAPQISTNPAPTQTICTGGTPSLLSVAYQYGTGTPSYQWYSNTTNSNTGGTIINGATSSTYQPPALTTQGNIYYYCVINLGGTCGSITSNQACVSVVADPVAATQPTPTQTVCVGGTPASIDFTASGGTGSISYQWYSNTTNSNTGGTLINGATTSSYAPPSQNTPGNYYYYAIATVAGSGCGTVTSNFATVTFVADPTVTIASSQVLCLNAPSNAITATASGGSGALIYQWFCNATNSNSGGTSVGSNSSTFSPPTTAVGTKYYYCVVSTAVSGCSVTSSTVSIQVLDAPTFVTQPATSNVCIGGTTNQMCVTYQNGTGTPTYQWYSNVTNATTGGSAVSGATSSCFTPPSSAAGTTYYYAVITLAGGGCSSITSSAASVVIHPDPTLSTEPTTTQTLCVGGSASGLTVVVNPATGIGPFTYQWYSNTTASTSGGTSITGAIQASYTPPAYTIAGTYYYYCIVTDAGLGCGTVPSALATVIVVNDPTVTTQPLSTQTLCQTAPATPLTITASGGTGTLLYQWYSNTTNSNTGGTIIPGATSSSYTPPTSATGTTYYYCEVTTVASGCLTASATAAVIVNQAPTFVTQPATSNVCIGGTTNQMCVTYQNGTGTPTYQWYSNVANATTGGSPVSGATSSCYTPPSATAGTTYYYAVITLAGGGCSSITSSAASVVIHPDPTLSTEPTTTQTLCVGGSSSALTVAVNPATGIGPFTYQWYSNATASTSGGSPISLATQDSYTPPAYTTANTYYYYCIVTDAGTGCGTVTSALATVIVVNDPTVTTQPLSTQTLCQTAPATPLTITASGGTGTLLYQWYSNTTNSNTGGTIIPGATSSSYTPPTTNTGTTYYYCQVITAASGCSTASATAAVIVNQAPEFTLQPASSNVCIGGTTNQMCVTYQNGTGTPTYQWYSNVANATTGGSPVSGATSSCYTPPSATAGTTYYYAVITLAGGGCSSITSSAASVVIHPDPTLSTEPTTTQTLCVGGSSSALTVAVNPATGIGPFTYQWYSNATASTSGGSPISLATQDSYTPPAYTTANTYYYYCIVTDAGTGCGTVTSALATVIVVNDPTVDTQPLSTQTLCQTAPASPLTITASGGTGTLLYQWYSNATNSNANGTIIAGATTSSYTPPTTNTGTTYYYCQVITAASGCSAASATAAVIVNQAPSITTPATSETVCQNGSTTPLTVAYSNGTSSSTYQWYSNTTNTTTGGSAILNANTSSFTPPSDVLGTVYYYAEISFTSGGCSMIYSNISEVTVNPGPSFSANPLQSQNVCDGGIAATPLSVTYTNGTGTVSYQWYSNTTNSTSGGNEISNATQSTYTPPALDPAVTPTSYYYYCVVTLGGNGCSAITSDLAEIIVVPDPGINTEPLSSQTLCQSAATAALVVAASGGVGTLQYQWYSNSQNSTVGSSLMNGETQATFTPPSTNTGTTYYYCVVTSTPEVGCSTNSAISQVVVNQAPTVNNPPIGSEACVGGDLDEMSVTYINGTSDVSYQWYSNTVNSVAGGTAILNANLSSFTPTSIVADTTFYYAEILFQTGGCLSIYSPTAMVVVHPDPQVTTQPTPEYLMCVGGSVPTMTVETTGGVGQVSYQWYMSNTAGTTGSAASAASANPSYSPGTLNSVGDYYYAVNIEFDGDGCDIATSNQAHIEVIDDPVVTIQFDQSLCEGAQAASITSAVTGGAGVVSYTWLLDGQPIAGETNSSIIPSTNADGVYEYTLSIQQDSLGCAAQSVQAVTITVTPAPTFSVQPEGSIVCAGGQPNTLNVAFTDGTGTPNYQWYSNTQPLTSGGTLIQGATLDSYTPPISANADTIYYYCEITLVGGGCSLIASDTAAVVFLPDATQLGTLPSEAFCEGGNIGTPFNVDFIGGNGEVTYQWYSNTSNTTAGGDPIAGATLSSYLPPVFTTAGNYYYYVEASYSGEGCNSVLSNIAFIDVVPDPTIDTLHFTQSLCEGAVPESLIVIVNGGVGDYAFQWYGGLNSQAIIAGATDSTYLSETTPPGNYTYFVEVTTPASGCFSASEVAQLEVNPVPTVVDNNPLFSSYCHNEQALDFDISFVNGTGTPGYQWYASPNQNYTNGQLIIGATNPNFTPPTDVVDTTFYYAELTFNTGGCPMIYSPLFEVLVNPFPSVVFSLPDNEICIGDCTDLLFNFNVTPNTPSGLFDFNWTINGPSSTVIDFAGPNYTVCPTIDTQYTLDEIWYVNHPECSVSPNTSVTLIVHPLPIILTGDNEVCSGETNVSISASASPATDPYSYEWMANPLIGFNPSNASSANQSVNPPTIPGPDSEYFYYVVEVTNDITTCVNVDSAFVWVHPLPAAVIELPPVGCIDVPVLLGNGSNGAGDFVWLVDGAPYSTEPDPADPVFTTTGFHSIEVTAITEYGCTDYAYVEVEIITPPTAFFTLAPDSGCAPLPVAFTNLSSGQYVTYTWDFGDGTSSDFQNPNAVIYQQGDSIVDYQTILTVENLCGVSVWDDFIKVFPTPVADIYTSVADGCTPLSVDLYNQSVGLPDTYLWDFGDGSTSNLELPPPHIFYTDSLPTVYYLTVTLTNECGVDVHHDTITVYPNDLDAFFSVESTFGCTPFALQITDFVDPSLNITYDFGNGDMVGYSNPYYIYNEAGQYEIIQEITNGCAYARDTVRVVVFQSPTPSIDLVDNDLCFGEEFQFIGMSDVNAAFHWTMGDGNTYDEAIIEHIYDSPGIYDVTLEVSSAIGCSAEATTQVEVFSLPQPSANLPSNFGCSPFDICFSNSSNGSVFYEWDFGDGNFSALANPCHTFVNATNQAELYEITLTAIDLNLCEASTELDVIVAPVPTSAFTLSSFESCYAPVAVDATNFSIDALGYEWYIDGVPYSSNTNTQFELDAVGTYEISLMSYNAFGCENTTSIDYVIHPLPDLDFTGDTLMGCTPHEVDFINLSQGASIYYWEFGDGDAAYSMAPSHTYNHAGTYDVSLIGITDQGCMDTLTIDNMVVAFPVPFAMFTMDPDSTSILQSEITFLDQSMGATQWHWDFGDGNYGVFQNAVHRYYEHGYYPVTLTVWNQFGCPSKAINYLKIEDVFLVYVPNAFTPDADGTNDTFFPEVNAKQLIETYKFQVYDRWGTIVFETDDPDMPWIGNVRGGDYYAEDGIYTWQVFITRLDSEDPYFSRGHVTLIR